MRILYSHRTRAADGQSVHIQELTKALRAAGAELMIIGPEGENASTRALHAGKPGRKKTSLSLPRQLYEIAEFGYSAKAYHQLAKAAARFKPDVIYERYNLYYHAGAWLARAHKLPLILEVNAPLALERSQTGKLAFERLGKISERCIWQAADMVLPVTDALANHVRAAGVDDKKIRVIQNGVSDAQIEPLSGGDVRKKYELGNKTVLGFTGFVRAWHGVEKLLNFIAKRGDKNLHALIVGDGPARTELEHVAARLNISDQVTFTGVVQRDHITQYVAAFDIALQPAVVPYASPLKLFEYMAQAKAIVAPARGNIKEVLSDNTDALLFTPGDDASFEAALSKLVDAPALRARLAQGARDTLIARDYSWAGNAKRVLDLAEALCAKKARFDDL